MSFNIRDYVSDDHIESIGEIATGQASIIQALSLDNSQKDKEIERLKQVLENIHEEIKYLYRKPKGMFYDDIQTLKTINEIVEKELKGVDKE